MIRIKDFDADFKTRLYSTVEKTEDMAGVEAVVMIKNSSGNYLIYPVAFAGLCFLALLTFFMFSSKEYDPYMMYTVSFVAALTTFSLLYFSRTLLSKIIPKKVREKNVEIYARALFQKAKIYKTENHIGFFAYFSLTERTAFFLADYGIILAVEDSVLKRIQVDFQAALTGGNPKEDIIKALENAGVMLSKYIPPKINGVNELPDDLDIDL